MIPPRFCCPEHDVLLFPISINHGKFRGSIQPRKLTGGGIDYFHEKNTSLVALARRTHDEEKGIYIHLREHLNRFNRSNPRGSEPGSGLSEDPRRTGQPVSRSILSRELIMSWDLGRMPSISRPRDSRIKPSLGCAVALGKSIQNHCLRAGEQNNSAGPGRKHCSRMPLPSGQTVPLTAKRTNTNNILGFELLTHRRSLGNEVFFQLHLLVEKEGLTFLLYCGLSAFFSP